MINDESTRGNTNQPGRKPMSPKGHTYSPSSSYNYNHGNNYNGNGYNSNYNNNYNGQSQHPRRRTFKPLNYNEKIAKQNDIIIKLLKEIRDRLPAPVGSELIDNDEVFERDNRAELTDNNSENMGDEEVIMENSSEGNCETEFDQENPQDEFDDMNRK